MSNVNRQTDNRLIYYILVSGHDRMVLGFITACVITKVVRSNPDHGEVYSIQHYVIMFVSDLRQVGGILRVLWFPPPRYN